MLMKQKTARILLFCIAIALLIVPVALVLATGEEAINQNPKSQAFLLFYTSAWFTLFMIVESVLRLRYQPPGRERRAQAILSGAALAAWAVFYCVLIALGAETVLLNSRLKAFFSWGDLVILVAYLITGPVIHRVYQRRAQD